MKEQHQTGIMALLMFFNKRNSSLERVYKPRRLRSWIYESANVDTCYSRHELWTMVR